MDKISAARYHATVALARDIARRWGWTLRLKPDGTTIATSPDGRRTYHSHGPPGPGHRPPGHQDDPPAQAA
jgi:hypothetical protein